MNEMLKNVHVEAIEDFAEAIQMVWVEFSDEDLSELAEKSASLLRTLAARIRKGDSICENEGSRDASSLCILSPRHDEDHQDTSGGTWP
jgi:hypothetical protein